MCRQLPLHCPLWLVIAFLTMHLLVDVRRYPLPCLLMHLLVLHLNFLVVVLVDLLCRLLMYSLGRLYYASCLLMPLLGLHSDFLVVVLVDLLCR